MDADWSDSASFTHGVPVKISENFRPPRKVKLPSSCYYKINTDVLTDEYDFTLEKNISQWIADRKEFKQTSRDERNQRIAKYESDKKERLEKLREQELERERIAKEEELENERIANEQQAERERIEKEELAERERLAKEQEDKRREEEERKAIEDEKRRLEEIEKQKEINDQLAKQAAEVSDNIPNGDNGAIMGTTNNFTALTIEDDQSNDSIQPKETQTITSPVDPRMDSSTRTELPRNGVLSYPNHIPKTTPVPVNPMNSSYAAPPIQQSVLHKPSSNRINNPGYLRPTPVGSCSPSNFGSPGGVNINFAEFEATSDPFDTLALKSINDMEELAKVWQASEPQKPDNQYAGYQSYGQPYQNGLFQYRSPTYPVPNPAQTSTNPVPISSVASNDYYQSYTKGNAAYTYQPTVPSYTSSTIPHPPVNKRQDLEDFYSKYYLQKKNKSSGVRSGGATPVSTETKTLRSCNSVPDLTSAEDVEVEQLTSVKPYETPVATSRPASTHFPGSLNNSFSEATPTSKLSDPFSELSPDAQILVQNVSEMGFSRPRVARAVQKLGIDHKKLIEVLLALQDFQDAGNDEYLSEKSFYFYMGDLPKVTEFLASAKQLLSFGFPEDKVADILFKHQNDQEKALEELIA